MRELRQSIARDVMVLLVLSSDHVTGATGKTLTITASKNGAAFAGIAPTVTERGNGWYAISLTAAHTDTLGDLALHITAADTDPLDVLFDVKEDVLAASGFVIRSGTAQGGAASWITLDAGASATDDLYSGLLVVVVDGTGAGQARVITNYDGTTKEALTDVAWAVAPDNTSVFRLLAAGHPLSHVDGGGGGTTANNIAEAIWGKTLISAGLSVGSYGEMLRMMSGRLNGMMVMDNVVNGTNGMTSARIRIFEDEADVGAATDGGVAEGEVATFEIEATYEGVGKVDVYRARRTA